jgi:TRAP-type mannitol/chloroaromatic compound transport system substrate-binding protein
MLREEMTMDRRVLLGVTATAIPASLAAPAIAQTAPEVRWRLTSSFPKSLDLLSSAPELVARRVAALTDNRFQIRVFAAGEIVGGLQALDAVQAGTVEAAFTAPYYYVGKDPTFAFFSVLPFGLTQRQMTAWLRHGGGIELANELFKEYNVLGFPTGDTGAQMGGWFRKEIRTPDDFKGLKFRVAGLAGEVFARMGAVPIQIAAGDIYPSLERGTLDAVEFVGPHDDERLGFARVAPYYYYPGFFEPSARLFTMVNLRAWEALPEQYKQAFQVACLEQESELTSRYDHSNPQALRRLVAAGTQLRAYSRPVLETAWRAANTVFDEIAQRNERFRKVLESYRRYRDDEFTWFRVAENSYDNFAFTAAQTVR